MGHLPPIQKARDKNLGNIKPKKSLNRIHQIFRWIFISVQSVYDPENYIPNKTGYFSKYHWTV